MACRPYCAATGENSRSVSFEAAQSAYATVR